MCVSTENFFTVIQIALRVRLSVSRLVHHLGAILQLFVNCRELIGLEIVSCLVKT